MENKSDSHTHSCNKLPKSSNKEKGEFMLARGPVWKWALWDGCGHTSFHVNESSLNNGISLEFTSHIWLKNTQAKAVPRLLHASGLPRTHLPLPRASTASKTGAHSPCPCQLDTPWAQALHFVSELVPMLMPHAMGSHKACDLQKANQTCCPY